MEFKTQDEIDSYLIEDIATSKLGDSLDTMRATILEPLSQGIEIRKTKEPEMNEAQRKQLKKLIENRDILLELERTASAYCLKSAMFNLLIFDVMKTVEDFGLVDKEGNVPKMLFDEQMLALKKIVRRLKTMQATLKVSKFKVTPELEIIKEEK